MSIFSENLKYLRKKKGLEQLELARILGRKSSSTISEWEKGTYQPKSGVLSDIAKVFNVTMQDLMQKDLSKETPTNLKPITANFIKIPVIGEIACGDPILAEENVIDYHVEPADLLPAGNLFYLKAKGDSMEPKIPNQSLVLIREQSDVESGEIAAVLVNGNTEATLKRVKKQNGYLILHPDNSSYEPMIVDENNPARIIGKALQITAKL